MAKLLYPMLVFVLYYVFSSSSFFLKSFLQTFLEDFNYLLLNLYIVVQVSTMSQNRGTMFYGYEFIGTLLIFLRLLIT